MQPARILILGGTGFVGHMLCEALTTAFGSGGTRLRVPTRKLRHAREIQMLPLVDVIEADVHDDATLDTLVAGCDVVVNLIAILHGSAAQFDHVHVQLPRRIAAACSRQGVKRLVHVSALGVGPDAPSNYLRSKTAGEAVLQQAGLALTVLRPSVVYGADDHFLNLFASLQAVAPFMPLAHADAQFQPVWVCDLAAALAACVQQPATAGHTYEICGPEVMTLADIVRAAGRWSGHPRPVLPIPDAAGQLQALLLEALPGEPMMSRDNLASMQVPNVATGKLPTLKDLGITPAAMASIAPEYLGGGRVHEALNRYRARH